VQRRVAFFLRAISLLDQMLLVSFLIVNKQVWVKAAGLLQCSVKELEKDWATRLFGQTFCSTIEFPMDCPD